MKLSKFLRRSLLIFIIKVFRTIVSIFIVISKTFRPIWNNNKVEDNSPKNLNDKFMNIKQIFGFHVFLIIKFTKVHKW